MAPGAWRYQQPVEISRAHGEDQPYGVDVVEGAASPPFAINIDARVDASVNVQGSQGVQIGGSGNSQSVTINAEQLNNYIDSTNASPQEKEEAKGLLCAALENPLVKAALGMLGTALSGGPAS